MSLPIPTPDANPLETPEKPVKWDGYALEEVEKHAAALKAKCIEITRRCRLPSVTDYTVKMAIRELAQENAKN